jgi:DNA replication protein DnaC
MKFEDLYLKGLDRKVNPAVSASDLNEETVNIEIDEYVFTDDIINNLYEILRNIRENHGNHTGIWINGYYGSGKSHFLKYVDYCLSPKYGAKALGRLREAVAERKPMELNVEPRGDG